jgi:hypothetical protein
MNLYLIDWANLMRRNRVAHALVLLLSSTVLSLPSEAQTLSPPSQDSVLRVREFAVAYNAALPITPSFTFETWVSIDTPARNGVIMGRSDHYLGTSGGAVSFCVSTGGGSCAISPAALPLNTWTHVAGVFDAAAARFSLYFARRSATSALKTGR